MSSLKKQNLAQIHKLQDFYSGMEANVVATLIHHG
jgi:hypothetical protein